jgi:uncharacterized protein (DUF58 family)
MPASRLFMGMALGTLMLAVAAAVPALAQAALVLDLVLLLAFALDLRRAAAWPLLAEREWPPLLVQGAPAVVTVWVTAPRGARLKMREALAPGLAEAPLHEALEVPAGARRPWHLTLHPRRRGTHTVGPLTVRVLGPWKLAWSQRELIAAHPRRVYPQVRWEGDVGRLLALADRRQLGQAPLRSRGIGTEPYALREFRPGDPLTRVSWKASARHGRLISREDTWERGARLVIVLDCARAMTGFDSGRTKLDHALAAALALMRVAVGRGDRVSFVAFSDRIERSLRVRGSARGVSAAYESVFDLEARLVEPAYDLAAAHVAALEPRRATVVLLTSVVDLAAAELLQEALARVRRRHRPVLVNLEDPEVSQLALGAPETPADAFAKVAAMEILLANRRLAVRLQRAGIRVATTAADQLAWRALEAFLAVTGTPRAVSKPKGSISPALRRQVHS